MRRRSNKKVVFETSPTSKKSNKLRASPNPTKVRSEVKGRSKIFNKLNKNRNCLDKDIYECMSSGIEVIGDLSIIGAGSFGILLRANTKLGDPIAIKMIIKFTITDSGNEFNEMERELAFSYYMGDVGIGPEVLDSFYYNFDLVDITRYPELYKILKYVKNNINHKRLDVATDVNYPTEIQFIVMKSYEYDCKQLFLMKDADLNSQIITQMIELMKKQVKLGIYCNDVKPGNFVGNISKIEDVTVKMIDFGADFCTEKQIYTRYKNNEINADLGVSYVDVLLISNIIQIYAMFNFIMNYDVEKENIKTFFNYPIFNIFFSSDWKAFLRNYLRHARMNDLDKVRDPSNQLVHYCNQGKYKHEDVQKFAYVFDFLSILLEHAESVLLETNYA
jgi:hypothetical protein